MGRGERCQLGVHILLTVGSGSEAGRRGVGEGLPPMWVGGQTPQRGEMGRFLYGCLLLFPLYLFISWLPACPESGATRGAQGPHHGISRMRLLI